MSQINLVGQLPRIAISIAVGILFVGFPTFFENLVMYIIGCMIILFGVMELVSYFLKREDVTAKTLPIKAVIAVIAGVVVLTNTSVFTAALMFSLGFVLLIIGVWQAVMYLGLRKISTVPMILYVSPTLTFLAGVVAIVNPFGTIRALVVFFGIMLLFCAVSELISMIIIRKSEFDESAI